MGRLMDLEAEMTIRAKSATLSSCKWLTESELSILRGCELECMNNLLSSWKAEMMVFSIEHHSTEYYPCYAFDKENGYEPATELKFVLQEFGGSRNGWALAFWFASVNGHLGGLRPQDLYKIAPEQVLEAARDEVIGIRHG